MKKNQIGVFSMKNFKKFLILEDSKNEKYLNKIKELISSIKKAKTEIQNIVDEFDERKKEIKLEQYKIEKDRENLNKKRQDLVKWRERIINTQNKIKGITKEGLKNRESEKLLKDIQDYKNSIKEYKNLTLELSKKYKQIYRKKEILSKKKDSDTYRIEKLKKEIEHSRDDFKELAIMGKGIMESVIKEEYEEINDLFNISLEDDILDNKDDMKREKENEMKEVERKKEDIEKNKKEIQRIKNNMETNNKRFHDKYTNIDSENALRNRENEKERLDNQNENERKKINDLVMDIEKIRDELILMGIKDEA